MKYPRTISFLVLWTICVNALSAQTTSTSPGKIIAAPRQILVEKPRLFNNLPEKFTVYKPLLDQLFSTPKREISIPVKNGLALEGNIIEKVQQNPNVISINIRLNNYDSSLLTISRIIESDLSVSYNARVMNIKSGDILLLTNENGQFYFTREKQSLIAVE